MRFPLFTNQKQSVQPWAYKLWFRTSLVSKLKFTKNVVWLTSAEIPYDSSFFLRQHQRLSHRLERRLLFDSHPCLLIVSLTELPSSLSLSTFCPLSAIFVWQVRLALWDVLPKWRANFDFICAGTFLVLCLFLSLHIWMNKRKHSFDGLSIHGHKLKVYFKGDGLLSSSFVIERSDNSSWLLVLFVPCFLAVVVALHEVTLTWCFDYVFCAC